MVKKEKRKQKKKIKINESGKKNKTLVQSKKPDIFSQCQDLE